MLTAGSLTNFSIFSAHLASFFPDADNFLSTQGIMVMLLGAYAFAMWMFLSNAPKVYTIMVSDLEVAEQFYKGFLRLSVAQVPLHYYYNYEQTLGTVGVDPMYLSSPNSANVRYRGSEGLWYLLKKNTQLHIIGGANLGEDNRQRHVCFDNKCLEIILLKVQSRRIKYRIKQEKPLNFLVKDLEDRVIELVEVSN